MKFNINNIKGGLARAQGKLTANDPFVQFAWPDTTLGSDTSGFDYLGQTYRRAPVFTVPDMKIRQELTDKLIFSKMIGNSGNGKDTAADMAPIIWNRDLKKKKGDTIRQFLTPAITGIGISGDGTMYGNEQILDFAFVDTHINQVRQGVKTHGEASSQRGMIDILEQARPGLQSWYVQRFEEDILYTAYNGWSQNILGTFSTYFGLGKNSSTSKPARYWYCADSVNNAIAFHATDATYINNIEAAETTLTDVASDRFSPDILEGVASIMHVDNFPLMSAMGFSGFMCVIHPYQLNQLRTNDTWFRANIHAGPRDLKQNPIFAGANNSGYVGEWNGMIIFVSNKITTSAPTASNGETLIDDAGDADVRRAVFMGAGSITIAEGGEFGTPNLVYEESDYGNKKGVVIRSMYGMARTDYVLDTSGATEYRKNVVIVSTKSPATTV